MNEVLLDQLPILTPMLRGFEEMALMADNNIKSGSSFIVEVLPELRAKIVNGRKQAKEDMERMMKLYTSEVFEDFMEDPKCGECGQLAT